MKSKKRLPIFEIFKKYAIDLYSVIILVVVVAALVFFANPNDIFSRSDAAAIPAPAPLDENSVRIPILMYHHFADDGNVSTTISGELFGQQLRALRDAGYNAISFQQLRDFVFDGGDLPEQPFIITIDDGYLSVYEIAFPLLKYYEMKATTFIIGVTHGMDTYKDTGFPIIPRFDDAQAVTMVESGYKFIESHSYDMHQHEPFETGPFRRGVLRRDDESEEEYIEAFRADFKKAAAQIEAMLGARPFVYSYPFGISNDLTDGLLQEMGVEVTLKITQGTNIVTRGDADSLMSMHRFNVPGDMAPDELLEMIR